MNVKLCFPLALLLATTAAPAHAQMSKLKGMMGKKDAPTAADTSKAAPAKAAPADKPKGAGLGGLSSLGSKMMTKAVMGIAKVSGGAVASASGMQMKVSDLSAVAVTVCYINNTNPADLGVAEMDLYGEKFVAGATNLVMQFGGTSVTEKAKGLLAKVDGEVLVDGKPMSFATMGVYNSFGQDKTAARKVEITTSTGQKSTFTIPPVKHQLKLLSINGQKDNPTVDLTRDLVLEVDVPAGLEGRLADVSLMGAVIGIRSFISAGSYPLARRMVIPAAGFRHTNQPVNASFSPSFLQLNFSEVVPVSNQSGPLKEVTCINVSQDGMRFNAPAGVKQAKNLTAKSSVKGSDDKIGYELTKGTAHYSRPVSELKKIGFGSLAMTGDTYSQTEKKYKTETATTVTTTTNTRTVRFPVLVPAAYEAVLAQLYTELSAALQAELGVEVVPLEQVTSTPAHAQLVSFTAADTRGTEEFSQSYKGMKTIPLILPLNLLLGPNNAETRLLREARIDGVLKVKLNLQIAETETVMTPTLSFELSGAQNNFMGSTSFFKGSVSGPGVDYNQMAKDGLTLEELTRITRQSDLVAGLRRGLHELLAQEKAAPDYEAYWAPRRGHK